MSFLLSEYDVWLTNCISGPEQTQLLPAAIVGLGEMIVSTEIYRHNSFLSKVQNKKNFKKNMAEISSEVSACNFRP